jgi:predicted alpha/beta-fold hydrolase
VLPLSRSLQDASVSTDPVIVFCPGFGSNSFSRYAETFVRRANTLGYTVVVPNARGAAIHPSSVLDVPTT